MEVINLTLGRKVMTYSFLRASCLSFMLISTYFVSPAGAMDNKVDLLPQSDQPPHSIAHPTPQLTDNAPPSNNEGSPSGKPLRLECHWNRYVYEPCLSVSGLIEDVRDMALQIAEVKVSTNVSVLKEQMGAMRGDLATLFQKYNGPTHEKILSGEIQSALLPTDHLVRFTTACKGLMSILDRYMEILDEVLQKKEEKRLFPNAFLAREDIFSPKQRRLSYEIPLRWIDNKKCEVLRPEICEASAEEILCIWEASGYMPSYGRPDYSRFPDFPTLPVLYYYISESMPRLKRNFLAKNSAELMKGPVSSNPLSASSNSSSGAPALSVSSSALVSSPSPSSSSNSGK